MNFAAGSGGVDADDHGWATPMFQSDIRHSMDMSAFLVPSPMPPEEAPPPYSEQLLEGHVTLLCGGKPQPHKDDDNEDPDSTLLSARDISILNCSTQSVGLNFYQNNVQSDHTSSARARAGLDNMQLASTGIGALDAQVHADTSYTMHRNMHSTLPINNPFHERLSQPTLVPPLFQRPFRNFSVDNSNLTVDDGLHREQPIAGSMLQPQHPIPFSPRLLPIDQAALFQQRDVSTANPLLRPARLPPLHSVEGHRRRNKRRRGNSWHGETVHGTITQTLAVNSPIATCTVAE